MRLGRDKKSGQAMVEYIIIVVIVAIAALVIFGLFGDRIRSMLGGAVEELGGDAQNGSNGSSLEYLRDLDSDGSRR